MFDKTFMMIYISVIGNYPDKKGRWKMYQKEIISQIEDFINKLKEKHCTNFYQQEKNGSKLAKIFKNDKIYAFVALKDFVSRKLGVVIQGDILKPETYRAPAKWARGNIYDANPVRYCEEFGLAYLR